ncbi:MAG TPA: hypothetical protein VHF22_03880, partial [Planctomycetota bacterium]|nr:hypothetical protein [Planctomycetota bacterium]
MVRNRAIEVTPADPFGALLDRVYDAIPHPDRWAAALELLRRSIGAAGAHLQIRTAQGGRVRVLRFTSEGYDARLSDAYRRRLFREDPYWPAQAAAKPPALLLGRDVLRAEAVRATPFHEEYLAPQRLEDPIFLVAARRAPDVVAAIGIDRRAGTPPWSEAQVALAARLLPHAARWLDLSLRTRAEAEDLSTVLGALECLPAGLVLLDRRGEIGWCNRAARAALDEGDGLRRDARGALHAWHREDAARLAEL